MKALRNFLHNGVYYAAGDNLDGMSVVSSEEKSALVKSAVGDKKPSDLPLVANDLADLNNKITEAELKLLQDVGVVGQDDQPLPKDGSANASELKYLNYQVQEGDAKSEAQSKADQAASHATNVATNVNAPQTTPSQVVVGTPEDAEAAIAKSNAAQAQTASPEEGTT